MWVDLPPVTWADIQSEFQKPLSNEVISVWECKLPDFQEQFNDLQTETTDKTKELQEEIRYSDKEKIILRNIYCSLWYDSPELKKAIEKQAINLFKIPWKDLLALYKNNWNILYISESNWGFYFNLEVARDSAFAKALKMLYKTQNNIDEVFIESESRYEYYRDGNKINSLSDEYINMLLMAIEELKTFWWNVIKEWERRRKLWLIKE